MFAEEDLFINPTTFNKFEERTKIVTGIAGPDRKVWLGKIFIQITQFRRYKKLVPNLGETSSCSSKGAEGMTDRFLATFLWLDKLGLGAKLGLEVIVRQTIWGYNYPLLNESYLPNPVSLFPILTGLFLNFSNLGLVGCHLLQCISGH